MLADQCFALPRGRPAHGLVRGSDRFAVRAVVDRTLAGRDAGEVLDGIGRGIPIVVDVPQALRCAPGATVAVVGEETPGGTLTPGLRSLLVQCARAGLDLVSGLRTQPRGETPAVRGVADAGIPAGEFAIDDRAHQEPVTAADQPVGNLAGRLSEATVGEHYRGLRRALRRRNRHSPYAAEDAPTLASTVPAVLPK